MIRQALHFKRDIAGQTVGAGPAEICGTESQGSAILECLDQAERGGVPMAFEMEDLEPQNKETKPKDLSGWSIEELGDYITALEAEIERARQTIAAKEQYKSGADDAFKL
jgi:uncharacterized small protein (DUF1192 family)